MNRSKRCQNRVYPLYDLPRIQTLRELVELKYKSCPGNTAFSYSDKAGNKVLKTFSDVYHDMNALESRMSAQGIRNCHIALIGENSYPWLVVFLAVVNGDNVAVPIDKSLPGDEIACLLRKADVTMAFCSEACKENISGLKELEIISFHEVEEMCSGMDDRDRQAMGRNDGDCQAMDKDEGDSRTVGKDDGGCRDMDKKGDGSAYEVVGGVNVEDKNVDKCCCIFFTSGTSGVAKGVCLSQRNLASEITQASRMVGLGGNTVSLLPFHHAFGLVEGILAAFHYGYEIYLNQSIRTVKRSLAEQKPQNLFLVPLYVETFHRQVWAAAKKQGKDRALRRLMRVSDALRRAGIDLREKLFRSVREAFGGRLEYIICGGAALDPFYVREFRSWGIEILNGYGTTECSPCVAVNRNFCHKDGTVGLPLPDVKVEIAPDGEIRIRGDIVMLGYYKDPGATAEVLQNGWYAAGDLGYVDKDGFLILTGRKKNLIILSNGENVSPEELEAAFARDDGVREVLVYEQESMIVAEIYPEEAFIGDEVYFDQLLRKVNKKLPAYKRVARVILRREEFVKNSSMKIVRYPV